MSEPDGRASGYLMDLINFLRSIFQVFTHLPVSIKLKRKIINFRNFKVSSGAFHTTVKMSVEITTAHIGVLGSSPSFC